MTQMTPLESRIDTRSDAYHQALSHGRTQVETLRTRLSGVAT
jgi:3-methylcrotonyl-CoA carboxylase beta subunit